MKTNRRFGAVVLFTFSLVGCSCEPKTPGSDETSGGDHPPPPPVTPTTYRALNVLESSVTLPAFFVGAEQQLSKGCFKEIAASQSTGASEVSQNFEGQRKFEAGIKAALDLAFMKAELDASLLNQIKAKWTLDAKNFVVHKVDPANIQMNFASDACTAPELKWFEDNRTVVTGLLVAGEITVTAQLGLDQAQRAKLEAAITKIKAELGASVSNEVTSDQGFTMKGNNLAIGAFTTTLATERCHDSWTATSGESRAICDGKYRVTVTPASVGERYAITVVSGTQSSTWDEAFGQPKARALGDIRLIFADVDRNLKVNFTGLLAGAVGGER
jgi:hypothetical protein